MSLNQLRKVTWLRDLPERELKRVLAISDIREFTPQEHIFSKAEIAHHMFIVLAGRVKIYSQSAARKRKIFTYVESGDFFGEMAVLDDKVRSASAEAMEPCRLLIIPKRDFKRLLLSDARLTYNLLKALSERLRRADEEIENLLFRNLLGRVAKTLCDLSYRCGKRFREGILLQQRFTQQELAELVGTTREPLARALAHLRRAELLGARHGLLWIPKPERLKSILLVDVRSN